MKATEKLSECVEVSRCKQRRELSECTTQTFAITEAHICFYATHQKAKLESSGKLSLRKFEEIDGLG